MEVWSGAGTLQACRRGSIEVRRYGVLEARCRCSDVEAWSSGALEACRKRKRVAVEAWTYGALKLLKRATGVATWRY